jgi:predicted DsbA family dithiol-disulfide isomerase
VKVEIWSDVVCPWCYIGKRRFEGALARFAHADEVEVHWRSYELDPRAPRRRSGTMADHVAAKYGVSVASAGRRLEELNRLAAAEGLTYDLARTTGGNTFDAHRLIHLAATRGPAAAGDVKEALFRAYFSDLQPVGDTGVLAGVARDAGLDPAEVEAVLSGDRFADAVRRDEDEAAQLGCTGVPFFVIDRAWAVPGAQDAETFLRILDRAWSRARNDRDLTPPVAAGPGGTEDRGAV